MTNDPPLRRDLTGFDATSIVIGAIVGVGIFFTPSRVAALAGSAELAMIAWIVGGIIAMLGALTFAELGALIPRAGGQYDVLREAYGPALGFVYVICNATAIQAGSIGIIAWICVDNLAVFVRGSPLPGGPALAFALGLTAVVCLANAAGARFGAKIQNVTVVLKVATLLAIAAVAFLHDSVHATHQVASESTLSPATGVAAALVPVLFAFGGWQQVLWMGAEVRSPERNLPIAIVVGVLIVIGVYLAATWAYFDLLGHAGVAGAHALAADAMASVYGEPGKRAVALAVGISALGVLNAQLLTGPRLLFALARDGRFFAGLARVHATRGTPVAAIILLGATAALLLAAAGPDGLDRLLTGVVLIDGLFFGLTGFASIALARRYPHGERPVRMPGFPVVPALFGLAEFGVVVGAWLDPAVRQSAIFSVAWVLASLGLYALRFRATPPPRPSGPPRA